MTVQKPVDTFDVQPIGIISSTLTHLRDCPLQESENAPGAYLEIYPAYIQGIKDIAVGDRLVVLTWLHLADRTTIQCHMRNLVGTEEYGVFSTRSPGRPNPIGLHNVTVVEIVNEQKLKIFPMEVLHGTPVIDIKPCI